MTKKLPIREGELNASAAIQFFDNIYDEDGHKLTKSKKRTRLKEKMTTLYYMYPELNKCVLSDGREVEIIVCRQNPGRGAFCYFNNIDAPQKEIFEAFALISNITYKGEILPTKRQGELIATDAKQFLDDIYVNGKKLAGAEKLKQLHCLFEKLYADAKANKCQTAIGEIPIIVARNGENNRPAFCLNTAGHREEVFKAFAQWAGCTYRQDKENAEVLHPKQNNEMTARECARIFHNVPNRDGSNTKKDCSPKLVEWFAYIADNPKLNQVKLPDGQIEPLVIARQSYSQKCLCLNTADEFIKPFVIWQTAHLIKADICMENIPMTIQDEVKAYRTMQRLTKQAEQSRGVQQRFYQNYAEQIYSKLNLGKELTLIEWLKNKKHSY